MRSDRMNPHVVFAGGLAAGPPPMPLQPIWSGRSTGLPVPLKKLTTPSAPNWRTARL